jgi:hypothetical protein
MALLGGKQVYLMKWTIAQHQRDASDKKFMFVEFVDHFFFFLGKKRKKFLP